MKLICGTTAARKKARVGREGKVSEANKCNFTCPMAFK